METKANKKTRKKSLQGLRAVAFFAIFSEHVGITRLGCWGVSCFLVLSGFLMYYNYGCDREALQFNISIKNNIAFAIKKLRKLYLLHFLTFILALLLYWDGKRLDSLRHITIYIVKAIVNILLLQSWFPKAEFYWSFNAVSWYLSTAMLCYFAFPYIRDRVNRIESIRLIVIRIIAVVVMQSIVSALLLLFNDWVNKIPITISDDLTKYITYICPIYRLGDFYLGYLLGYIYNKRGKTLLLNNRLMSIIEVLLFAEIIVLQIIYNNSIGVLGAYAFKYTLLYTLNTMLIIYVVSINRGIISSALSSKWMIFFGEISGYAFLIHQLVIVFFERMDMPYASMILFSFVLTLVFAYIYYLINIGVVKK